MEPIWSTRAKYAVKELLLKVNLWPLGRPLLECEAGVARNALAAWRSGSKL